MQKVAKIFTTINAAMFELTIPDMKGFSSTAPKYSTPMTVVKQSMEPIKTRIKLGNISDFSMYISLLLPL